MIPDVLAFRSTTREQDEQSACRLNADAFSSRYTSVDCQLMSSASLVRARQHASIRRQCRSGYLATPLNAAAGERIKEARLRLMACIHSSQITCQPVVDTESILLYFAINLETPGPTSSLPDGSASTVVHFSHLPPMHVDVLGCFPFVYLHRALSERRDLTKKRSLYKTENRTAEDDGTSKCVFPV
ncbi:hypothetical protein DPEC_G00198330 [Dallia pectoralis]|uniref:Uncharacterized protein n=1 Tax=Dallia pectoralis TaxID=75939 RepID=A0ACC2G8L9_DALPE|nr:hypothetical protein DPEC_G00198330 [Dallia pectoralis]